MSYRLAAALVPADGSGIFVRESTEGGRFHDVEATDLIVDDIRAFFRSLRK